LVKKVPAWSYVGAQIFETKAEAKQFTVTEHAKKKSLGYKTRYEVDMDPQTGKFKVREFVYMTNNKGELV